MSPPKPMPNRATARMIPNMKTVPPRSGPSIRYQTSSIKKKTNPTTPEATGIYQAGKAPRGAGTTRRSPERASTGGVADAAFAAAATLLAAVGATAMATVAASTGAGGVATVAVSPVERLATVMASPAEATVAG